MFMLYFEKHMNYTTTSTHVHNLLKIIVKLYNTIINIRAKNKIKCKTPFYREQFMLLRYEVKILINEPH